MSINLPPGWEVSVDPTSGRTFYVNHNTQQTSWTPPIDSPLPRGWEELRDEHGRTFFYNAEMNKTTWQDPRLSGASSMQSSQTMAIDPSPMPSAYPSLSASSPAGYNASHSSNSEPKYRLKIDGGSSSARTWTCSQCTFENPNSSSSCEMCGYSKSGDNPPAKPTKPGSLAADSDAAMAAALQEELNREAAREESFADREGSEEKIKGYQATEPFELLPNMVPDETSTKCLRCSKEFGKLINRKHHCRCCGMLVCADCSTKKTVVRLPTQEENLNEKERRVCDWCYDHLVDGHAHCLYRYVIVASKEQDENRELAIKGIVEIMEQLPQQMSSSNDRAQANRDLEILKFVGGVAKMCSFLSPGDRPSTQAQACRLVAALASASCIRELENHLPKRQVASEMSEGAALAIMSTILERSPNSKENLNAQISAARVLYLLGDVPTLKSAAREAGLIGPLCDALLSSDGQLQDWSCMCLGRLLKGDRSSVEEVLKHNGIHNLVLLLSSTNTLIQEHAAVTLQEALIVDPVSQAPKVKKALAGFSGTPAALRLLQSGEGQVVSAGLRLLLILSETEAQQIRMLDGIPSLVSIIVGNGNAAETLGAELQTLALQVLRNVANVGALERHAITQCGGLSASVTLMKSSTNSFVRKEATILVEALSSDADGARGVMEASGGIAGLVDVVKTSSETTSSFSASNALSQILLQGPEAQAAMLEAGALEALLAAGSRGDLPTACRVVEATFSFVSDPELLPKLAANVPPPTLAQRLIHLGTSMRNSMPGHVTEQLVLTLAVLCGAKADDYKMSPPNPAVEDETPPVLKVTAPQTRALVAANGSAWLVSLIQNSLRPEPGVALACLRCLLAVSNETMNGDKVVQGGGLPVVLTAIADNLRAGDASDTSSPQTQILLHAIALFARLCGGSRPRDAGRDMDSVKRGLRLLNDALECHEPECMLTSVRALSECSFQSGTWSTIAETALPRCVEMLLADKTGHGPGGRDPLSSSDVLRLLMDVSTITSNLAKLEVHANAILDSGGALALISLLSEPEDDATSSGVNALWALSESSRKCASMISRAETGAIVQLLHLSETHRNKAQATRALKLVKRLAETDGQNAAQIGATTAAVDSLLRLVRFEQSDDALGALCAVASASDALWERLADTSDVSSTVLILERGGPNSARIQGRACRAIAVMCDQNPAICVAEDVLRGALPTVVKLLSPADSLGADKSESPAVDAAWAVAMICHSGLRDNVGETLGAALAEYNALQGCIQMLMRERRLGRPRSQSTAQALRAVRALLMLAGHKDGLQFWQQVVSGGDATKASNRKDDVFSALVMALDANVGQCTSVNAKDAMQAVDDVCFLLATFPEGLPTESYLRLSRPLTQAFEKSLQLGAFRISCLKAMTRAVKETSLASAMVGSARAVASSLASTSQEKDSASAQIETGLLLAALLKNTPNDRIVQDAVASSGALGVLFKLLSRLVNDGNAFATTEESTGEDYVLGTCRALALLCESGGNAVKRALRQSGSEGSTDGNKGLILMLRDLIRDESDSSWVEDSKRDYCFRILTRIASLDEHREEFFVVKSCCFTALVKRKCLRPAIELLGWLGTVEGEDQAQSNGQEHDEEQALQIDNEHDTKEDEEQEEEVDKALLEIAFDKTMPVSVRLQALQSCEFFIAPAKQQQQAQQRSSSLSNKSLKMQIHDDTLIAFPKEIFYHTESKKLFYPALLVLERLIRARRVDIQPLLPSLISVMKLDQNIEDNQGLFELVCSCLFEACRKSPKVRQLLKSTEGFLKVFKGMNLYNQLSAQKLLKVLGEEFIAEKPVGHVGPSPMIKRTDSGSVSVVSSVGEKRSQDERKKTSTNGVLSPVAPPPGGPPPPPPLKSAFPTFTATPSAQERSSLDLAMRLQQLEMSNTPVTATSSYPRAPSMPPPSFSSSPGSHFSGASSSSIWNCSACTLENEMTAMECAACGQARPGMSSSGAGGGGAMRMQIQCSGCGSKLQAPSTAASVSCPNCRAVTSLQGSSVRVRCKSCIKELFAPSSANQFKCSNCGTVGSVRDSKV